MFYVTNRTLQKPEGAAPSQPLVSEIYSVEGLDRLDRLDRLATFRRCLCCVFLVFWRRRRCGR